MTGPADDRSVVARAAQWASRIMVVSVEMVAPGLAGLWVDGYLGTVVVFTLAGFAVGSTAAIFHLLAMTRKDAPPPRDANHTADDGDRP